MVFKGLGNQFVRATQLVSRQPFIGFKKVQSAGHSVSSWIAPKGDCSLASALAISGATATLMILLAHWGFFQDKEIEAFDWMTQLTAKYQGRSVSGQPQRQSADHQVVIVGITEKDIQSQKHWPLSDQVFAQLLTELQAHSPAIIGLDIYRDFPSAPGTEALAKQLQRDNVIVINKLDNLGRAEVPAPLNVPAHRVGFNDFVADPDGVVRRNFMFAVSEDGRHLYSFALRIVEKILAKEGLEISAEENALRLGTAEVVVVSPDSGGYQNIDASSYQSLMRYFPPSDAPLQLSLSQVLSGDVDANLIKGKIVLIGTTAPSQKDLFYTPFSSIKEDDLMSPGVVVHAQMTRQLLSAALEGRSLFGVWSQWEEFLWVGLWGLTGGLIAWRFTHPRTLAIATVAALSTLFAVTGVLFVQAVWVPCVLPTVTFGITGAVLIVYKEFRKTFYDSLTGLPNRTLITQALQKHLKKPGGHLTAVILLDIDKFKIFNESFGLSGGDRLLQIVSKRLKQSLPANATVARIAGDEFIVLLANLAHEQEAITLANRLTQQIAQPIELDDRKPGNQKIFPTISVGIAYNLTTRLPAQKSLQVMNAESLLRDAQTAMSKAKGNGNRGQCEVFVADMRTQLSNRIWIESDLREALNRQELLLYYQPLVCLKTMTVAGFEALIRWQHPEKGMISPGDFIPVAEDTGLIVPIGQWVLEVACQQAQQWRTKFAQNAPFISVNLSGRQFSQRDLVEQIDRILVETGLERSALKLELTESVVMDKVEESIEVLLRLKDLQLQLGIDDFGTGYSSLSYLHRFPIDTLKVDRSFVMEMEGSGGTAELVKTIIALGHNLDMNVVAEGIETPGQSQKLQALQCEYGQGYLFAKPLPAELAEALLAEPPNWQAWQLKTH